MGHVGAMVDNEARGKGGGNLMQQYIHAVHMNKPLISSKRTGLVLRKH